MYEYPFFYVACQSEHGLENVDKTSFYGYEEGILMWGYDLYFYDIKYHYKDKYICETRVLGKQLLKQLLVLRILC